VTAFENPPLDKISAVEAVPVDGRCSLFASDAICDVWRRPDLALFGILRMSRCSDDVYYD
jgi:hypothetical protein